MKGQRRAGKKKTRKDSPVKNELMLDPRLNDDVLEAVEGKNVSVRLEGDVMRLMRLSLLTRSRA